MTDFTGPYEIDPADQYEKRNETMQQIIDAMAAAEDLNEYGLMSDIADDMDVPYHRVQYVMDNWDHLVKWRRAANRNPVDGDVVKDAYDDDHMAAMADDDTDEMTAMADGLGNVSVNIEFDLDEAFRAMKLLPGDLGMKVFSQTLDNAQTELSAKELEAVLENN